MQIELQYGSDFIHSRFVVMSRACALDSAHMYHVVANQI